MAVLVELSRVNDRADSRGVVLDRRDKMAGDGFKLAAIDAPSLRASTSPEGPSLLATPTLEWPSASDSTLDALVRELADLDGPADRSDAWHEPLWSALAHANAPGWSVPEEFGGVGLSRPELIRREVLVAEGSLTAAFVLSQHSAAVRRLVPAADRPEIADLLRSIAQGRTFPTVGISQLTTSRRKGPKAVVATKTENGGYRLDGAMPWVTAAGRAELYVTGAVTPEGLQLLAIVRRERPGVRVETAFPLAALGASDTAEVTLESVEIAETDLLAGPVENVMAGPGGGSTGGLETSALALGQARAALRALGREVERRDDPDQPVIALVKSWSDLAADLRLAAEDRPEAPASGELRRRANALVLSSTQAYLAARKGTGFLQSEPAQRWARQAMFFLVWSCPSPVAHASIRDLAGLCDS